MPKLHSRTYGVARFGSKLVTFWPPPVLANRPFWETGNTSGGIAGLSFDALENTPVGTVFCARVNRPAFAVEALPKNVNPSCVLYSRNDARIEVLPSLNGSQAKPRNGPKLFRSR